MHLLPQSDAVLAELLLEQSRPGDALSDPETMFLWHQNPTTPDHWYWSGVCSEGGFCWGVLGCGGLHNSPPGDMM